MTNEDQKEKTPQEIKREKHAAHVAKVREELKAISKKTRKLMKLPRHVLVRKAMKVWAKKKAWLNFDSTVYSDGGKVGLGPRRVKSLSNVALRHLIATNGQPLKPIMGVPK